MKNDLASPEIEVRALVHAWSNDGDEAAARELMTRLYPQIIAIVRRHLPRRVAVEDLAQDIFVKLFTQLHRYDLALPLENWVSRLALNVCLDQLRAERRRPELRWADLSEEQAGVLENLFTAEPRSDTADHADAGALFDKLLETLNPATRSVVLLRSVVSLRLVRPKTGLSVSTCRGVRARCCS